jgi:hypothetical protein
MAAKQRVSNEELSLWGVVITTKNAKRMSSKLKKRSRGFECCWAL